MRQSTPTKPTSWRCAEKGVVHGETERDFHSGGHQLTDRTGIDHADAVERAGHEHLASDSQSARYSEGNVGDRTAGKRTKGAFAGLLDRRQIRDYHTPSPESNQIEGEARVRIQPMPTGPQ